jgi:protein dithiol:quinone oxidoreductase
MIEKLTPRICNCLLFGACVFAMGVAYYLDSILELEPCPLCMTQRVFVVGCGLFCLLAAAHGPGLTGRRIYAGIAALWAAGGGAVAARHVWLQHLPEDLVPACGPSLGYMLESFPFSETLEMVLMGDGNCADVVWTMFGLSIPEQALILFSGLLVANLWQLLRK